MAALEKVVNIDSRTSPAHRPPPRPPAARWGRGAMGIAGTFPRSRLPAVGRAKARWICHFASTTSTRSGCCQCWLEKQPERAITELGEQSWAGSTCARRESDPECDPGLHAPQRPAIPIAALQG